MSHPTMSIDTEILESKSRLAFYCKMCVASFTSVKHLFNLEIQRKIVGDLRRGDLTACNHPDVLAKLAKAKRDGIMSHRDFAALYQFNSLLRKLPQDGNADACRRAGYEKLLKGERQCKVTNMTMDARVSSNYALFDRVKTIIQDILGHVPSTIFSDHEVSFGPGSTVNLNGRGFSETAMFFKLTDRLIIPDKAKFYLAALVSSNPNWVDMLATHYHTQKNSDESYLNYEMRVFDKHFEVVPNDFPSRISFVPKDSAEFRTIGVEMNGLIPLQMVVGDFIRKQLKSKTKINLDSQERNRHMARLAQTFGLATIDLANASSSISLELVRTLLPYDWFILIDAFRSSHGCAHGLDVVEYEMVSSMGNGFTFELESLIFYALARATAEMEGLHNIEISKSLAVYGDDIIIPARISDPLIRNLTLFGFTANVEKSFFKGCFFESCGSDYYNCTDVRPFFLRRPISTIKDFYFLMNSIMFRAVKQKRSDLVDLYRLCFRTVNTKFLLGPLHFELNSYGKMSTDDLESTLRVPLMYAQQHGGVKYDATLFAWQYKKWINIAVEVPLSLNSQYAVKHARYMTFLKGVLKGKACMRGSTNSRLVTHVTSSWDGCIDVESIRVAQLHAESLDLFAPTISQVL